MDNHKYYLIRSMDGMDWIPKEQTSITLIMPWENNLELARERAKLKNCEFFITAYVHTSLTNKLNRHRRRWTHWLSITPQPTWSPFKAQSHRFQAFAYHLNSFSGSHEATSWWSWSRGRRSCWKEVQGEWRKRQTQVQHIMLLMFLTITNYQYNW